MARVTAQDVILEILRASDGEWVGKTRLYKAFYFAHLYYANEQPAMLTSQSIARMPQGPGIDKGDELLEQLRGEGYLTIESIHEGPYHEYRYRLTEKGRAGGGLPDDARCAIRDATSFCQNKSAAELSQLTHERSRSWNQSRNGDILDIYLDTIPDDEYERREAEIKRLDGLLSDILGVH